MSGVRLGVTKANRTDDVTRSSKIATLGTSLPSLGFNGVVVGTSREAGG